MTCRCERTCARIKFDVHFMISCWLKGEADGTVSCGIDDKGGESEEDTVVYCDKRAPLVLCVLGNRVQIGLEVWNIEDVIEPDSYAMDHDINVAIAFDWDRGSIC